MLQLVVAANALGCVPYAKLPTRTIQIVSTPDVLLHKDAGYSARASGESEGLLYAVWSNGTVMRALSPEHIGRSYVVGVLSTASVVRFREILQELRELPPSDRDDLAGADLTTFDLRVFYGCDIRSFRAETSRKLGEVDDLVPRTIAALNSLEIEDERDWEGVAGDRAAASVPMSWRWPREDYIPVIHSEECRGP